MKENQMKYIYIMSQESNTKIGITSNLDRKMKLYEFYIPYHELCFSFPLTSSDALNIKSKVKAFFKSSKMPGNHDWFSVPSYVVVQKLKEIIDSFFDSKKIDLSTFSFPMPKNLKLSKNKPSEQDRYSIIESFAEFHNLGIPEHLLVNNPNIINIEDFSLPVALSTDVIPSSSIISACRRNHFHLPYLDHNYRFYRVLPLANGQLYAFCTALATFPYNKIDLEQANQDAYDYDLHFITNEHLSTWNWYGYQTYMHLFIKKNPITLDVWNKSYRKWFIDHADQLRSDIISIFDDFNINYHFSIVHSLLTDDINFPLDIQSFDDFNIYTENWLGISYSDQKEKLDAIQKKLIELWQKSNIKN